MPGTIANPFSDLTQFFFFFVFFFEGQAGAEKKSERNGKKEGKERRGRGKKILYVPCFSYKSGVYESLSDYSLVGLSGYLVTN